MGLLNSFGGECASIHSSTWDQVLRMPRPIEAATGLFSNLTTRMYRFTTVSHGRYRRPLSALDTAYLEGIVR